MLLARAYRPVTHSPGHLLHSEYQRTVRSFPSCLTHPYSGSHFLSLRWGVGKLIRFVTLLRALVAATTIGCVVAARTKVPRLVVSVFLSICSFLGLGSATGLFGSLRDIMSRRDYSPNVCYEFPLLIRPGASIRTMPARDCQ